MSGKLASDPDIFSFDAWIIIKIKKKKPKNHYITPENVTIK
jgi:hypothetical protein